MPVLPILKGTTSELWNKSQRMRILQEKMIFHQDAKILDRINCSFAWQTKGLENV